jgi:uncharacterized protein
MLRQIAVIGASANPRKTGHIVVRDLLAKGFLVFPVNPHEKEILGLHVYSAVGELPATVELLVFTLPPAPALAVVREALAVGFRRFWFQPGSGSPEIGCLLEEHPGVLLVMDRCIMAETNAGRPLPA